MLTLNFICIYSDLPQHGQKQWQPHFAKTFESFTKLWKFQQENRLFYVLATTVDPRFNGPQFYGLRI